MGCPPWDIADAREGEVIADECELILHRHIENPLAFSEAIPGSPSKLNARSGWLKKLRC